MFTFPENNITRSLLQILAAAIFSLWSQHSWATVHGDFNLDGKRDLVDAIMIIQELSGVFHDVDGDGYTSQEDCDDTNPAIHPGLNEICDSIDNNCDGAIDEELFRACYSGPSGTEGVGLCKEGTSTCSQGSWSSCENDVLPANETCDGYDNNCNGAIDENCPSCDDSILNGEETDIDCGGPSCPDCGVGFDCSTNSDCTSGVCTNQTCQASACSDGVQNGTETDIDCGGSCIGCSLGQNCTFGSDCTSGICLIGVCAKLVH